MCHFLFLSVEDFLAVFTPNAEVLQSDMPNYTDITPVIQFNEVLIAAERGGHRAPPNRSVQLT
jgi:hypothetical protein